MFYINHRVMFAVDGSSAKRNALQSQRTCFTGSDRVVVSSARDGAVAHETLECSNMVDEALCYFSSAMFDKLHVLMKNGQQYMLELEELNDWSKVRTCQLEQDISSISKSNFKADGGAWCDMSASCNY